MFTPPRNVRRAALIATLAAMPMLAACGGSDKAPTGQVVAKVDGEDITRRDVQTELAAARLGPNVDLKAVQPLVVQQIVSRKLLVEEAKRQGIEKTPDYLAAEQRAREMVLAQMVAERWSGKLTAPTQDQVRDFIGANPQMFGERHLLQMDQIRTTAAGIDPRALEPLNSNDAIAAYLTERKHPFERGQVAIDTATLQREAMAQISALPPGIPFVLTEGGMMLINTVQATRPAPVPQAQWPAIATQSMTKQTSDASLRAQLGSLRSAAKVEYQPGFAPPTASKAAARP